MAEFSLNINEKILIDKIKVTIVDTEEDFDVYVTNQNVLFVECEYIIRKALL